MFNLLIVQAFHGDCLLLEYGASGRRRYLLIDGGPQEVYRAHLRPALEEIAGRGSKLDLVVLSHTDDDHVLGLVEMFEELLAAAPQPPLVGVDAVWMNHFDFDQVRSSALYPARMPSFDEQVASDSMLLRGIAAGIDLRDLARQIGLPINAGFARDLVALDTSPDPLTFDNLTLHIIGPTEANLQRLRREWKKWFDARARAYAAADAHGVIKADQSVPNRGSIMFLAEADGKRVLLTGDGRGDHIVQGLVRAGLMQQGGALHVDLMKLPHHGSARNVSRKFFNQITADIYAISADGQNGNPDLATLIWLVEAAQAQGRKIKVLITNPTPTIRQLLKEYPAKEYGYTVKTMPGASHYLRVSRI
jgi:beta-lactamase superfamily II metal-dependent hydrolase